MAKALAVARAVFRRVFSISAFTPPPPAAVPPPAEPSPNLFVSGLSKRTTSEGLREAFSKFGNVVHARVVTDRVSGYSKGFGFVRYGKTEEAAEGIKGMDGKFLDGWVIFAEYAKPRPPPPSQAQSPQPSLNISSSPPTNYITETTQSWSSYQSTQASEPLPSHSNYTPKETQTPSNYSYHSAQTLQSPPSYNSGPPSNYSSEVPPSTYDPQASQQPSSHTSAPTFSFPPYGSNPENLSIQSSSSYQNQQSMNQAAPNNVPDYYDHPSGNAEHQPTKYKTSRPTSGFESELAVDHYDEPLLFP